MKKMFPVISGCKLNEFFITTYTIGPGICAFPVCYAIKANETGENGGVFYIIETLFSHYKQCPAYRRHKMRNMAEKLRRRKAVSAGRKKHHGI